MTPEVFQVEGEFRKQGVQFSSCRCITVQECNGGAPLIEDIFKKFVSGEKLATRPNYGVNTEYFSWSHCGKFWEMNLITPTIKGNHKDRVLPNPSFAEPPCRPLLSTLMKKSTKMTNKCICSVGQFCWLFSELYMFGTTTGFGERWVWKRLTGFGIP
eukprot:838801-Amphidinium_carterae.1